MVGGSVQRGALPYGLYDDEAYLFADDEEYDEEDARFAAEDRLLMGGGGADADRAAHAHSAGEQPAGK